MISIQPFQGRYLLEASRLFAGKYRELQHDNDLLPAAFQDEAAVHAMLESTIWEHRENQADGSD